MGGWDALSLSVSESFFDLIAAFLLGFDVVVSAWRYTSNSVLCSCVGSLRMVHFTTPHSSSSVPVPVLRVSFFLPVSPFEPRFPPPCLTRPLTSDFPSTSSVSVLGFSFPSIVSIPHCRLTRAYLHLLTTTIGTFHFFSLSLASFYIGRVRLFVNYPACVASLTQGLFNPPPSPKFSGPNEHSNISPFVLLGAVIFGPSRGQQK